MHAARLLLLRSIPFVGTIPSHARASLPSSLADGTRMASDDPMSTAWCRLTRLGHETPSSVIDARRRTATAHKLRTSKPKTIHSCAQFGDLSGLQKRLEEDPSLLNAKNDIMAQTPLHVAAGYNKIDIVKYLLEWRGPEKVELESENMYGETPLHMAAKNGCSESSRLLLSNGASLEAKANNGMTPLHLAVWHARQALECVIVKTLLEHNADCSIKDNACFLNEGLTPLNHISEGHGSEKLRELLDQHIKEQLKIKAINACAEAKEKMARFEASLLNIVGLSSLKLQLHKWAKGMIFDEKRRALGLSIAAKKVPHMAFLGNPGTDGKLCTGCE